jgi:mRNA interferase RelE/StbE
VTYEVVLHRAAVAEIRALPQQVKKRVRAAIESLADTPVSPQAVRLRGRANAYRVRVGDYRLLYEVHATEVVVYVIGVAHRKDVYRHLLRRR